MERMEIKKQIFIVNWKLRKTKGIIYLCLNLRVTSGFTISSSKNLVCIPAFIDISIDGEERTAIKLIVEASFFEINKYFVD